MEWFLAELNLYLFEMFKGAQSQYFELFWPHTKLPLSGRKPENNIVIK